MLVISQIHHMPSTPLYIYIYLKVHAFKLFKMILHSPTALPSLFYSRSHNPTTLNPYLNFLSHPVYLHTHSLAVLLQFKHTNTKTSLPGQDQIILTLFCCYLRVKSWVAWGGGTHPACVCHCHWNLRCRTGQVWLPDFLWLESCNLQCDKYHETMFYCNYQCQ